MKDVAELVQAAEAEGISFRVDGDKLSLDYRKCPELDRFIEQYIKPRKAEIIRFMNGESDEPVTQSTKEKPSPTTLSMAILDALWDRIATGKMPSLLTLGYALDGLEIGPGLVTVIGAPPGAGKTTLAMQVCFESCENDDNLRVVVANRESSMEVLLQRELVRRTGVSSKAIRFGKCSPSV